MQLRLAESRRFDAVAAPLSRRWDPRTVYCATAPELTDIGGKYFRDCREHAMSEAARDEELGKRLWDLTETFLAKH